MHPILLFHGLTASPSEFNELIKDFDKLGWSYLAPQLSGHNGEVSELSIIKADSWLKEAEESFLKVIQNSKKCILIGQSFGGLLALHIAKLYPEQIEKIILLAPPIRFRKAKDEFFLNLFSYFPDIILDRLPCIPKKTRLADTFVFPREALTHHSLGAAARVIFIRRKILKEIRKVLSPMLIIQDPNDHIVSKNSPQMISEVLSPEQLQIKWIPEGEHELLCCKKHEEVRRLIINFLSQ